MMVDTPRSTIKHCRAHWCRSWQHSELPIVQSILAEVQVLEGDVIAEVHVGLHEDDEPVIDNVRVIRVEAEVAIARLY